MELTKELNELLTFDVQSKKFTLLGNHQVFLDDQEIGFTANNKPAENESPNMKHNSNASPMKGGMNRKNMYPGTFSNKKSMKIKPKVLEAKKATEKQESGLASPTSIQM